MAFPSLVGLQGEAGCCLAGSVRGGMEPSDEWMDWMPTEAPASLTCRDVGHTKVAFLGNSEETKQLLKPKYGWT